MKKKKLFCTITLLFALSLLLTGCLSDIIGIGTTQPRETVPSSDDADGSDNQTNPEGQTDKTPETKSADPAEKNDIPSTNAPDSESTDSKDSEEETRTAPENDGETTAPNTSSNSSAGIGDTQEHEGLNITLLDAVEYETIVGSSRTNIPSEGHHYLVMFLEAENISDIDIFFNSMNVKSYVDGYAIKSSYILNNPEGFSLMTGEIAPGKRQQGYIAYEVPEDWEEFEFTYFKKSDHKVIFIVEADSIK